jgi:HD-GYP domain-containing protein (c-di-GMP phosphodiesterase class II)
MLDMSKAAIADLEVSDFGICQAVMVFGEDDHAVGAYNSKVGNLVGTLCVLCGFDPAEASRWAEAASLHDLGKLWIPPDILLKRGSLSAQERKVMEDHVIFGYTYLKHLSILAAKMALSHHENFDGTGYPEALKGDEIPMTGRMVRLCDVYDALRTERPYKKAMTHEEAVETILHGDDRIRPEMFDPGLLCLFTLHHCEFEASFDR